MYRYVAPMLDIISIVQKVRQGVSRMDRPSAFAVFVLTFPATIVSFGYMWAKDLLPTWWFVNGQEPQIAGATPPEVAGVLIGSVEQFAWQMGGIENMTLGTFIGVMIATGVTMFPSVLQFIAPSVAHPIATTGADLALWFDYLSDMPAAWAQAGQIVEFWPLRALLACVLTFVYSVVIQSLFVMLLVACISAVMVLVSGGGSARAPQRPQLIEA